VPILEAGYIFGMVLALGVFTLIVVVEVRRCNRSHSFSGYEQIN